MCIKKYTQILFRGVSTILYGAIMVDAPFMLTKTGEDVCQEYCGKDCYNIHVNSCSLLSEVVTCLAAHLKCDCSSGVGFSTYAWIVVVLFVILYILNLLYQLDHPACRRVKHRDGSFTVWCTSPLCKKHVDPNFVNDDPNEFLKIEKELQKGLGPLFQKQKLVGTFQIDENLKYKTDIPFPVLIAKQNYCKVIGTDLNDPDCILMEDYTEFHTLKLSYFMKCLRDSDFMKKVEAGTFKKPDFICLGGIISDPMLSLYRNGPQGEWKIFGTRFNDIIHLWEEKICDKPNHFKGIEYGLTFPHHMTNEGSFKAKNKGKVPNLKRQTFIIQEITFGEHQLLCLNEVDAVTRNGKFIETKVSRDGISGFHNRLSCWGQSVVPGINELLIGTHNDGIVTAVRRSQLKYLNVGAPEHFCRLFQHRLLKWIKDHLRENDKWIVKEFYRGPGTQEVVVKNVCASKLKFDLTF